MVCPGRRCCSPAARRRCPRSSPTSCRSRPPPSRKATAAGRRRRPPRRSRAASGGRRSPIRCSTTWSSAPNRGNTSIQVAAARLAQARAFVRATDADRSPQVGVGASATRAQGIVGGVAVGQPRNIFAAGVDFSYEAGPLRPPFACHRCRDARRPGAGGLLQSARLLVQAQVAQTYLALRALDAERALVRSTVGAYRETLHAHRAPLARGRRRRARRRACEHRGLRDRVRCAGARPPAAPSSSMRSRCWWAKSSRASRCRSRNGTARCPSSRPGVPSTRAHAPARRVGGAADHARRAGARRRGEGGLVPATWR